MKLKLDEILKLEYKVKDLPNLSVVIYGAGISGMIMTRYLVNEGVDVIAICDSDINKVGVEFEGYKVKSIDEIKAINIPFKFMISVGEKYYSEIKTTIINEFGESFICEPNRLGDRPYIEYINMIKNKKKELNDIFEILGDVKSKEVFVNILKGNVSNDRVFFSKAYSKGQYFNDLTFNNSEGYFIDAGAFIGDTLDDFIANYGEKFKGIYCFEPFKECFDELVKSKSKYSEIADKIILINKGLYSDELVLGFTEDGLLAGTSIVESSEATTKCEVASLDSFDIDDVSFIKMDIEGSELEALKGATKTILRSKPKLAICVYHKPYDIIEIPKFIESLDLGYKFYLRHHQKDMFFYGNETVLYAI